MKVSHILDSLVHPLCNLTAGIVFTIPIVICGCIPILGWFGIAPLAKKANAMSDSLYNKYRMSEFRSRLNIESSHSKSKTDENQSSSLKDEINTKQTLAQNTVTIKEAKEKLKVKIEVEKPEKEIKALKDEKTKNEKEIPPYLKDFLNVKKKNPINDLEAVQTDTEIRKEETQIKVMKKEETKVKYNSIVDELTKLGELKEKGLLTEEEFNEQKKKLLKQ